MRLIAGIAAGAGIIAASFLYGRSYEAGKIKAASANAKAEAEFLTMTHKQEVFLLERKLDSETINAKENTENLIADINSGNLRLRTCLSNRVPENNSAARGTNADGGTQSNRAAARAVVRVGAECDRLNDKFNLLQDWARSALKSCGEK